MMGFLSRLLGGRGRTGRARPSRAPLTLEVLESRRLMAVTAVLNSGVLAIAGGPERDNILVQVNSANQLVVSNNLQVIGFFASPSVTEITISAGNSDNIVSIDNTVTQLAVISVGAGRNVIRSGGGPTTILTGGGNNKIVIGTGQATVDAGTGHNNILGVKSTDTVLPSANSLVSASASATAFTPAPTTPIAQLTPAMVEGLLNRAQAATSFDNMIIAVLDRSGNLLGVRVGNGVSTAITSSPLMLSFAVDGAMAEARTAAFFASDAAPLTPRTIQAISQTTITQREVESNPSINDINSTLQGPGYVAPIQVGGHFPPGVAFTPQVDLYDIQGTNRDTTSANGERFNTDPAFTTSTLTAPDSYGEISGILPNSTGRGIGTLPGGVPLYLNGHLVGGIGVFFPGTTGYADEENSSMGANFDPTKIDLSQVAEYIAFAAEGGTTTNPIGNIAGLAPVTNPMAGGAQINLVGITLPLVGGNGVAGVNNLIQFGQTLGTGNPFAGIDLPVVTMNGLSGAPNTSGTPAGAPGLTFAGNGQPFQVTAGATTTIAGQPIASGWLVTPHDGAGITAAQVVQIVDDGINQANVTRAAIRLPVGTRVEMVFAVSDENGNIVGLYREADATVFSIDVAVAKARNVAYYNNPDQLQTVDAVQGIPDGTAFTARTFRFLALPRFPEGINGQPPGPFSILNDPGTDPNTGLNTGAPVPASAFQSVQGFTDFNPQANFRDPFNKANQNGVVFFPGSQGIYDGQGTLIAGFGVSGDGVDQDDVVTMAGGVAFQPPDAIRVDNYFVNGVRLVYNKNNRNPEG
jgi:uncharacterized protein GlcG (DUF336 family)